MYSQDFRRKVLKVKEKERLTLKETAQRFDIGIATVVRWVKRIEGRPAKTRRGKIDKQALLEDVKLHADAYIYERANRFGVSTKAIWQMLKKLGVSYKKNATPSQSRHRGKGGLPRNPQSTPSCRQGAYFCR